MRRRRRVQTDHFSLSRVIGCIHRRRRLGRALSFLCSLSSAKKGRLEEDDLGFIADKKLSPPLCVPSLREEEEEERLHKSDRRE